MAIDKVSKKKQTTPGDVTRGESQKGPKKFYPLIKDVKFIEAVDYIIERNRAAGIKPKTDSGLAKIVYPPNRSIISAVRSKTKHIPETAVVNLGLMFSIDFNFFWREDAPMVYTDDKEDYSGTYTVGTNKFSITEEEPKTKFDADKKILDITFLETENAINALLSDVPSAAIQDCLKPLSKIQIKARQIQNHLTEELAQKKEELEKIADEFEQQLKEEKLKTEELRKELIRLGKSERKYLEK